MNQQLKEQKIIEWASQGFSVYDIVDGFKRMGITIGNRSVSSILKNHGYVYDAKIKQWVLNDGTLELPNIQNESLPIMGNELLEANRNSNAVRLVEMLGFTPNEFNVLKVLVQERMTLGGIGSNRNIADDYISSGYVPPEEGVIPKANITDELARLKVAKRKNRTYYISEELNDRLAEFADARNMKQSNLIEVALIDFFKRYE